MHPKSLNICIIANYRVENTGSCQTTHEECLKTAKFQNVSLKPLKGAIWSCKTREHPWTNFVLIRLKKPSQLQRYWRIFYLSITKIFAGFYLKYFMRSSLPLVSRLVSCNIWSERERSSSTIVFSSNRFLLLFISNSNM